MCIRDSVSADYYGLLQTAAAGVKYLFVVIDNFTKYVRLFTLLRATTTTTLRRNLCFDTVSYTHLDVYKRQVQFCVNVRPSQVHCSNCYGVIILRWHTPVNLSRRSYCCLVLNTLLLSDRALVVTYPNYFVLWLCS